MEDLKIIFASNLIKLRTEAGMTQAELAEQISYSDKSVSKWERGEAVPDAYVLKRMSELFGVSVDSMLSEGEGWKKEGTDLHQKVEYSQLFIILCAVAGIFTLSFLEFVIAWAVAGHFHWLMLYAGVPCALIALLVMNSVWYKGRNNMYIVAALVAAVVLFVYLLMLRLGQNTWQILLVIIPAEIVVYFAFHIRKRKKTENREKPETLA